MPNFDIVETPNQWRFRFGRRNAKKYKIEYGSEKGIQLLIEQDSGLKKVDGVRFSKSRWSKIRAENWMKRNQDSLNLND